MMLDRKTAPFTIGLAIGAVMGAVMRPASVETRTVTVEKPCEAERVARKGVRWILKTTAQETANLVTGHRPETPDLGTPPPPR